MKKPLNFVMMKKNERNLIHAQEKWEEESAPTAGIEVTEGHISEVIST